MLERMMIMLEKNNEWGRLDIVLGEYLEKKGISKNKIADSANLQRSQLIAYCRNEVQRPDLSVLARICYVLKCEVSEIIRYTPPSESSSLPNSK
ncbi:MAG: helix-turn-helix domain-containing protein [Carboxydocellales bacterium]